MGKFLVYCGKLLLIGVIILFILDFCYTHSYYMAVRSKQSWLKSSLLNKEWDYVFIGSSRCIHHVDPKTIQSINGKKGVNLGYSASGPVEKYLMVREVIDKLKVKTIYIEVGLKYNSEYPDNLAIVSWLPFSRERKISRYLSEGNIVLPYAYNFPFYRYIKKSPKIGYREVILNYIQENAKFIDHHGYLPIKEKIISDTTHYQIVISGRKSRYYNLIDSLCSKANIDVVYFTSPIYNTSINTDLLEKNFSNYHDYSNLFKEARYFMDRTHLNDAGALKFSTVLANEIFD